jgi:predicted negative regulator of RcsB-dependent stress response
VSAYTEQEELEKFKAWWKNYGGALVLGVVVGVGLLFGNKYWQQVKEKRLGEASEIYDQLVDSQRAKKAEELTQHADTLMKDHDASPYAALAALALGQANFDKGDLDAAKKNYEWAERHARQDAVTHAARLRWARLELQQGNFDKALNLATPKNMSGFDAEYLELKGDVLTAQKKPTEAAAAYREALKKIGPSNYQGVLTMKLDALGVAGKE